MNSLVSQPQFFNRFQVVKRTLHFFISSAPTPSHSNSITDKGLQTKTHLQMMDEDGVPSVRVQAEPIRSVWTRAVSRSHQV